MELKRVKLDSVEMFQNLTKGGSVLRYSEGGSIRWYEYLDGVWYGVRSPTEKEELEVARDMMVPPKTPKLRKGDKANFSTLEKASSQDDLALVSAVRKSDNAQVALVCAMSRDEEDIRPVPLAVMVEGNPFEDFYDPTQG